jgi:signal transduction histidine kinase
MLKVTVTDNGAGIDPEARRKIFLPFFTTKDEGTGMGLAHVHKIVTAHGGEVAVESVPGGGTTFLLRLPTVYADAPQAGNSIPEAA